MSGFLKNITMATALASFIIPNVVKAEAGAWNLDIDSESSQLSDSKYLNADLNPLDHGQEQSSRFSLVLHIGSRHSDGAYGTSTYDDPNQPDDTPEDEINEIPYNSENLGIGVQYNISKRLNDYIQPYWEAGGFKNSYREPTIYIGYGFRTTDKLFGKLPLALGLDVTLLKGYKIKEEEYGVPFTGAILPYILIGSEKSRFTGKIGWIPKQLGKITNAEDPIHTNTFSINVKLGKISK